ncbi:MAG: tRNA lysidine(34) synthetase TilS [Pseudomonadota bacterium]
MQVTPPDATAVAAFLDAIERLTNGDGARILLAVSGGPDSLALLLLAHAAMPDRISAATVDHGLRIEAADEATFVARICEQHGVSHVTLVPTEPIIGNIQSSARIARYRMLHNAADAANCRWIATAHHADDQLETLLMRLMRGSGIDGMASIRPRYGRVLRPLLAFDKSQLETICANAAIEPVRDPSNDDKDFDRVALRQWLATSAHAFDTHRAVRTGAALAEAAEALDWTAKLLAKDHLQLETGFARLTPADLPPELRRRLLKRALWHIEPGIEPRGDAIDRALVDLANGKRFTLGNVLCEAVGSENEIWHFRPAPPRR